MLDHLQESSGNGAVGIRLFLLQWWTMAEHSSGRSLTTQRARAQGENLLANCSLLKVGHPQLEGCPTAAGVGGDRSYPLEGNFHPYLPAGRKETSPRLADGVTVPGVYVRG